ncbi:29_t:CDS:2, partial [Racocetra fulgida]
KGSKNKKRQVTNSDELINSGIQESNSVNIDVQISALEVLKTLFTVGGSSIPCNSRITIDNIIMSRILAPISQFTNSSSITRNESDIQLKLYECLLASIVAPSVFQSTILPHALQTNDSMSIVAPIKTASPIVSPIQTTSPIVSPIKTASPIVSPIQTASPIVAPIQTTSPIVLPIQTASPIVAPIQTTSPIVAPIQTASSIMIPTKTEPSNNSLTSVASYDKNLLPPKNIITLSEKNDNVIVTETNYSIYLSDKNDNSNMKRARSDDISDLDVEDQTRMHKLFREDYNDSDDDEDEEMPEIVPDSPDSDYESSDG